MIDAKISLKEHELHLAAGVGLRRQIASIAAGRKHKHGMKDEDGWRAHIEGACGEYAAARFLGRNWDGSVDTFRSAADLGETIEVRTRSQHNYELIVRKDDDPARIYIHVTGSAPRYWVRGWIRGSDAMKDEWLQSHGGREAAYFVPNEQLHTRWPAPARALSI